MGYISGQPALIGWLIADTGYELSTPCERVTDRDQLCADPDIERVAPDKVIHRTCGLAMPEAGEVWDSVVAKGGEWLGQTM